MAGAIAGSVHGPSRSKRTLVRSYLRLSRWLYQTVLQRGTPGGPPGYAWSLHSRLSGPYAVDFRVRTAPGFLVRGNTRDMIQRFLYVHGVWEPHLTNWLRERLAPGDVFVDVGANIGYCTLLASGLVGEAGRVVSIEASPRIFGQLSGNLAANRVRNVRALHVAVSDAPGTIRIFRAGEDNLGATSIYRAENAVDEGEVAVAPLSGLLAPDEIARARVIKIDVEGAEIAVIDGLLPCLGAMRDDLEIVVEIGGGPPGSPRASESFARIRAALASFGFHAYAVESDYGATSHAPGAPWCRPRRVAPDYVPPGEGDVVFSRRDADGL